MTTRWSDVIAVLFVFLIAASAVVAGAVPTASAEPAAPFTSRLPAPSIDPRPGDAPEPDLLASRWLDSSTSAAPHEPFTLWTRASDTESRDGRAVLSSGERWRLAAFEAVARKPGLDTRLTAYGRLAYAPARTETGGPLGDDPVSLGLRGDVGDLELGGEYRSLGRRFERVMPGGGKDQEGAEVWLARRLGPLRLKLSQSDLTDNVDDNPALPRTTRMQTAVTTELLPPGWPVLGLTLASGDAERVRPGARSAPPERQDFHAVTAQTRHDAGRWGAALGSTYSRGREPGADGLGSEGLYHDATLWLSVLDGFTITSSTSLGDERGAATRHALETASSWLTLAYAPPHRRWHAWTLTGGASSGSSDKSVDGRSWTVGGGLGWDLGARSSGRSTLSFEAGYDHYLDAITRDGSSRSVFGFLLFTIASP